MVIVDLQQVMIASVMMQMGFSGGKIEIPMLKHMVLNSLRSYRAKYTSNYGEMVIATDTGSSWRRTRFPYYKANRSKDRDESALDWEGILDGLKQVRGDLREYFPYRIIEVEGAEADDIIGTLVYRFGSNLPGGERILILSADKDFKQLQTYMNVEQYDPVRNKKVVENNPKEYLLEHTIRGDTSDGIPNILSGDDCLVMKIRQGTMTKKRFESLMEQARTENWESSENFRRYCRNREMIDLSYTPAPLRDEIVQQYESQAGKSRDKVFGYLMKNRMKHLMEYANEF